MLPTVLCVDALEQPPDVEGIDIWGSGYTWHRLPANPGIYCFYDGKTGEILYIGSASARGEVGWRRGIAGRMLGWRTGRRSASEKQLQEERRKRSVLVRCWVTQSAGDALKYEAEAIEKYKPPLNEKLVKPLQSILESGRRARQRNSERPPEALPPRTTIQRCSDCDTRKPLSDFHRCRSRRSGHASVCKKCIKIRDQRRHALGRVPAGRVD